MRVLNAFIFTAGLDGGVSGLLGKRLLAAHEFIEKLKDALPTGDPGTPAADKKTFYTQLVTDLDAEIFELGLLASHAGITTVTRTALNWVVGANNNADTAAYGIWDEDGKMMSKFDLRSTRA